VIVSAFERTTESAAAADGVVYTICKDYLNHNIYHPNNNSSIDLSLRVKSYEIGGGGRGSDGGNVSGFEPGGGIWYKAGEVVETKK
jgi:hypothetical protein